jgi:hypothetical protein
LKKAKINNTIRENADIDTEFVNTTWQFTKETIVLARMARRAGG